MKKMCAFLFAGMLLAGMTLTTTFADEHGTAAQAKLLVEKAVEFAKANGKDKTLAELNNPKGQFVKGDLYVYAWDSSGKVLANPVNPKMVGTNVLNSPDVDGKYFRKDAIELAKTKGSGWVDYKYQNPKTNQVEQKTAYVKKMEDLVIGCGAYK